jgi:diguanylate cyclase (GGDEF)-like protein
MTLGQRSEQWARPVEGALVFLVAAYAALLFGLGSARADSLIPHIVYLAVFFIATALVLARAVTTPTERAAWLLIGAGMATMTFAETYWTVALAGPGSPPYPSLTDASWLASYPFLFFGFGLLVRARVRRFRRVVWLDGVICALAICALGVALIMPPILDSADGATALAAATTLAYPISDLLLISFVGGMLVLTGWRAERSWALVATGLLVIALGDAIYGYQSATGSYADGTWLDLTWPLSLTLIALAAWRGEPSMARLLPVKGWRAIAAPVSCSLIALGVLVYGYVGEDTVDLGSEATVAVALAALALLAAAGRMALTYRDNQRLATETQTDHLTGLGNRSKLLLDLRDQIELAGESGVLVTLNLDGFKLYNDAFGRTAGDGLLRRLSGRLAAAVEGRGGAYRIGGDEFCILLNEGAVRADGPIDRALNALSEEGHGFTVTASHGAAKIPDEADDPEQALQLADKRMDLSKGSSRVSARSQAQQVLMRTVLERAPELSDHTSHVGRLAEMVASRFTSDPDKLDVISRAADLHDIGKMAIPEAILAKPGPLNDEEHNFILDHTLIGDRILSAAPALAPVAKVVRSSHERYDGDGYPDQLAGAEIPLGSRIISVCDAFEAMTSTRPYSGPMPVDEALDELRACSGTQFDPGVVEVACEEIAASEQENREPVYVS